jgi:hypothetical protein
MINADIKWNANDANTFLDINDDCGFDRDNLSFASVLHINKTVGKMITISTNKNYKLISIDGTYLIVSKVTVDLI